jgi:hypothetical protein
MKILREYRFAISVALIVFLLCMVFLNPVDALQKAICEGIVT